MTLDRRDEYLASLVQELRKLSEENEWVEFKVNERDPEEIGEYVSALANSAAMVGKATAYLVWGISDREHEVPAFPELAVRELVANALIHQDFLITGAGPMVEIFEDRIEITNPGVPLVDPQRFVDSPPRSRNEALASFMRRVGIFEERGSGWDKVVFLSELNQLPAPLAEVAGDNTRVVLFAPRPLSSMNRAERVRATYHHACLRYVNREYLTNTSVRERFGIEVRNSAKASRLISEAVQEGAIVPDDPTAAPKLMRYVPWWTRE